MWQRDFSPLACALDSDGKEGVRAFLEKRAAQFTSRASELPPPYPWWPI
jgi:hypothetical protein